MSELYVMIIIIGTIVLSVILGYDLLRMKHRMRKELIEYEKELRG